MPFQKRFDLQLQSKPFVYHSLFYHNWKYDLQVEGCLMILTMILANHSRGRHFRHTISRFLSPFSSHSCFVCVDLLLSSFYDHPYHRSSVHAFYPFLSSLVCTFPALRVTFDGIVPLSFLEAWVHFLHAYHPCLMIQCRLCHVPTTSYFLLLWSLPLPPSLGAPCKQRCRLPQNPSRTNHLWLLRLSQPFQLRPLPLCVFSLFGIHESSPPPRSQD